MKILVQGRSTQGHSFVWRAGRAWPTSSAKLVDVVDVKAGDYDKVVDKNGNKLPAKDKDGNPVSHPCIDGDDPPPVEVTRKNATTQREETVLRPDPERIGRISYQQLLDDSRIVIKQTDTVSQDAADAAVGAASAEVARLSEENVALKVRIASLESGQALKDALAEIAALKAPPAEDAKKGGKRG